MRLSSVRRLLVLTLFLLESCAKQSLVSGFTLRIGGVGPLDNLSPLLTSGYSMLINGLVFSLLFEPSASGAWRSRLLSEWNRVGSNRYRLKLNPSIHFSDGSSAGNRDLIESLAAFQLQGAERDGGVEVTPVDPAMPIDPLLLHAVLFKNSSKGPIGTGSFALEEQDPDRILLRRVRPLPGRIAGIELLTFSSSREVFGHAMQGQIHVLLMPDPGQLELLDGVPHFRLVRAPGMHSIAAVFNARRIPRTERKALAEALAPAKVQVHGESCRGMIRGEPVATIRPGPPFNFLVMGTDPAVLRAALALRRLLGSRTGLFEQMEQPGLSAEPIAKGLFDIVVGTVQVWPPSIAAVMWRTGMPLNFAGYSDPEVDEALNAGDYDRAEQKLTEDPPAVFLCRQDRSAAIDARIKNPTLGPYDLLESLPEWEVTP